MSGTSEVLSKETKQKRRETEWGGKKSTASARLAAFDCAKKEIFWTDNLCFW